MNTALALPLSYPARLAHGTHDLFLCGNDAEAKAQVTELLTNSFGWKQVIDLGDITAARGMEMLLTLWLRLWDTFQTPLFNFKVVHS